MEAPGHEDLLLRAGRGDAAALAPLFESFRPRLVRMVTLRLDPGLKRRVDPTDVVQEAWLEVARRFPRWAEEAKVPFHVWLRLVTAQTLAQVHRRHLAALEDLDEVDREIVALRHFEGLSNEEAAAELSIEPAAASKRFTRALLRLKPALEGLAPGQTRS